MYNGVELGENLAQGGPYNSFSTDQLFQMWANEKQNYTYNNAPSSNNAHYTQIVNKNVTEIGCGCANCSNQKFCVCRYNPEQLGNQPPY